MTEETQERPHLAEESVFQTVVTIADDDLAGLEHPAQRLAFAAISGGDERLGGGLAQDGELQVQFGRPVRVVDPQCPVHAWQGG